MKNDSNIHLFLKVFNTITSRGSRDSDGYHLDGVTAWSDFEGYTVTLSDDKVTLSIFFHNKYEFDYGNRQELDSFVKHLERLDQNY